MFGSNSIHHNFTELRQRFGSRLAPRTGEFDLRAEPSWVPELLSRFLALVTKQVIRGRKDVQGTYEDVLRLVLTEFEGHFLRGNEHPSLLYLVPLPEKRLEYLWSLGRTGKVYSKGLDVMRWLQGEESTEDVTYLVSTPVFFPLIGLVQLAHYHITYKILTKEPRNSEKD
ncbi:hypothetical protein HOY80DRAFT_1032121 [Tuber brumale]|nr:hypothetical protein HOY80DRAFT_1032121 [Tuber brumale]